MAMAGPGLVLLAACLLPFHSGYGYSPAQGPVFLLEPPPLVQFANSTGAVIDCSALGQPTPHISWLDATGSEVLVVPGLRELLSNGSLLFPPFPAETYSSDLHATSYRCKATNPVGTVISRDCRVRAEVLQPYQTQVHRVETLAGNVAVLRCNIPAAARALVRVSGWYREDDVHGRTPLHVGTASRYTMTSSGSLHIRDVTAHEDAGVNYYCETQHTLSGERRISSPGQVVVKAAETDVTPRIEFYPAVQHARAGSLTELVCAAQGHPPPAYRWFREVRGSQLELSPGQLRVRPLQSVLQFSRAQPEDSGKYLCVVSNRLKEVKRSFQLVVSAPLGVYVRPQHQVVDAGGSAFFNCSVRGGGGGGSAGAGATSPGGPVITWLKDGVPLGVLQGSRISVRSPHTAAEANQEAVGEDLVIRRVIASDRGMYQCVVRVGEETAQASAQLTLGAIGPELLDGFREQTMQPGPALSLHCVASGQPPPRITWMLDGAELPLLSRGLYQQGSFVSQRGEVISHLNVSSARVYHGGLYTCVASNILGSVQHSALINIYGPPSPRPPLNITVVADSDVYLRCPVSGFPVTSVQWTRPEGRSVPENMRQRVFPNGTLLIRGVQSGADRGLYSCTVNNQQGQFASSNLNLNIMRPPVIAPFSFHAGLEDGNRQEVSCSVVSGDLPITIVWRKDGAPLSPDPSVREKQHQFGSNLLFSDLAARHSGRYTCVASNAAASANYTAQLVVRVAPRWLVEPQDVEVTYQQPAALHCQASGLPEPTITWMKAGVEEGPGQSAGSLLAAGDFHPLSVDQSLSIAENGSVMMSASLRHHAGKYMCQAKNGIGAGISKVVSVKVNVPAHFHTHAVNVSGASGQTVVLDCTVSGDSPLTIIWAAPGGSRPPLERILETPTPEGMSSHLHLLADRQHAGAYICTARNKFGSDSLVIFLTVQEPPSAPVDLEVLEAGSRWLHLGWRPLQDGLSAGGSSATHYVLQFHRGPPVVRDQQVVNSIQPDILRMSSSPSSILWSNVTVSGATRNAKLLALEPATIYTVRILAANDVGVGPPSGTVTAQTLQEAPSLPPADVMAEALEPESLTVRWKPPPQYTSPGALQGYQVRYRAVSLSGQPSVSALPADALLHSPDGFLVPTGSDASPLSVTASEDGGPSWVSRSIRGAHKLEVTLRGLQSFTRYEVTVRAFNEVGTGPESQSIFATTMEGVPTEPPGAVRCTPLTSQNVRVRWESPSKAGRRGTLEGYKVFYRRRLPAGLPAPDQPAWMSARPEMEVKKTTNLETNLFGLAKFSNYTVQVAAFTSAGEGVRSEPVHCTTEEDVPGAPDQVKALAMTSDSILVTWTRPTDSNGIITKYYVYMRPALPVGNKDIRKETVYGDRDLMLEARRLKEFERTEFWVTAATSAGEGPASLRVSQAPNSRVPARIASFSRTAVAGEGQMLTLGCRAVGVPAPSRVWRGPHGLQLSEQLQGQEHRAVLLGDGAVRLGPLTPHQAGNYTCSVENVFGKDEIHVRVVVVGPPAAPTVTLADATENSLRLQWSGASSIAPITGHVLHFKRELGEWQERELDGDLSSYSLEELYCGSPYLITIAAVNAVGRGPKSSVLQASTKGAPPKVPAADEVLSINSTSCTLFLDAWPVAGCPITYFVVDFRSRESGRRPGPWRLVANRAGPQQTLPVSGLSPASWYELRVAAHSDAGSTTHQFVFATRTKTGDLVPLELMPAVVESTSPLRSPIAIIVIVVSSILCLVVFGMCVFVLLRKRPYAGYSRGDARMDELENQRNLDHQVLAAACGDAHQLYSPSPGRKGGNPSSLTAQKGSDTSDYEICPYATFSLANAGPGAGVGSNAGAGPPGKPLTSYSLQLHTFSQRDCYEEGPGPGQRRPPSSHYGSRQPARSKAPTPSAGGGGGGGGESAPRGRPVVESQSPPDGLSLEISCISSQQTLPMSMAVHHNQRRNKTSSPAQTRGDRGSISSSKSGAGFGRPHSLVIAPPARYESDSSLGGNSPSHNHHNHLQQHYTYRQHTPSRRSSKSQHNVPDSAPELDSSTESAEASPEVNHRGRRSAGAGQASRRALGTPSRSLPRRRSPSASSFRSANVQSDLSDAECDRVCNGDVHGENGEHAFLRLSDLAPVSHQQVRSQLLYPDANLEQELSTLIKRYRHDRQREKQDYTIHV